MTGNFSGKSRAFGGKPVLNEPFVPTPTLSASEWKTPPSDLGASRFVGTSVGKASAHNGGIPSAKPKDEKKTSHERKLREGVRLFNMSRWEDSLKELLSVDTSSLQKVMKLELSYYLGLCFLRLGKFGDAFLHMEKVVAEKGSVLRIYQCRMALAYIHVTAGRPQLAEFELRMLLDSGFESTQLFNTMAYTAYERKHYRHAIEFYQKVLKLDENNATALNGIGYVLADTGIDPLKGLEFCRKAVEIRPENAAYADSLGWVFYKCGELAQARKWLSRAAELAPNDVQIKRHLRLATGGTA